MLVDVDYKSEFSEQKSHSDSLRVAVDLTM